MKVRPIVTALAFCAVFSPYPLSANAESNEILVTAERLRKVGIDYQISRKGSVKCKITRTSGERKVDRLMCRMVRACVKGGLSEPFDVKTCVNEIIMNLPSEGEEAG